MTASWSIELCCSCWKEVFLSERDNYVFLHADIWTFLETFASPFLLYWFCWCWFVSIKNYVALPIMLSYILDIAFCNFLEVGSFYPTHSMQQSTSIHHIRIINHFNFRLEYWHSNDNNKYSKQNLILAHKITYEMIFLRFFRLKWRKKTVNPPLWILAVPRVLWAGIFFWCILKV